MKTIIDILNRGNLELFHSSMISWLLDPKGEHKRGNELLNGIARILDKKGSDTLLKALNSGNAEITTEMVARNRRYDIAIKTRDSLAVIENKTKSIGDRVQLDRYLKKADLIIPLGYTDISFSDDVYKDYVSLSYSDLVPLIEDMLSNPKSELHYEILIEQYLEYLKRELGILDDLVNAFHQGKKTSWKRFMGNVNSVVNRSGNEKRYINLFYLEKAIRYFRKTKLKGIEWETEKNEPSGVWMACNINLEHFYSFNNDIQKAIEEFDASFWFHCELHKGVLEENRNEKVGVIQLRGFTSGPSNKALMLPLKDQLNLRYEQFWNTKIQDQARSFYAIAEPIYQKDLKFRTLSRKLERFMESFGKIEDDA